MGIQLSRPSRKRYEKITTLKSLQKHLQWAFTIELSTIPPYLYALYSLQSNDSSAARDLRAVVFEEMLHMMLVSNLLNAIGASPKLSSEYVPLYPTYMPHHAAGGPYIQLQPYSVPLLQNTFMPIEQPETGVRPPAEAENYDTLGQFYAAIEEGFEQLGEAAFQSGGVQLTNTYFGLGGGHIHAVTDLCSAKAAIREIVQQGEGAPRPGTDTTLLVEPYGGYEHYGPRSDGTFGPIIGTPLEMSHYGRFLQLSLATDSPSVWPAITNPSTKALDGWLREVSILCDNAYALLLESLQAALGGAAPPQNGDREAFASAIYFGAAYPAMQFVLAPLASLLLQTPLSMSSTPSLGPNAGPSFHDTRAPMAEMLDRARSLLHAAPVVQDERGTDYAYAYRQIIGDVLAGLRNIADSGAITALSVS